MQPAILTTSFDPKTRHMPPRVWAAVRQGVRLGIGQPTLNLIEQVRGLGDAQVLDLLQGLLVSANEIQRGCVVEHKRRGPCASRILNSLSESRIEADVPPTIRHA